MSSVSADFGLGGPARDRAYAYSTSRSGKCDPLSAFVAVAPDGGKIVAVSSQPLACHLHCYIVATPDVDADGIPEIAVGERGFFTSFSLFEVEGEPRVGVTALHTQGGRTVTFSVGGSTQSMGGLICGPGSTLTGWGAAETAEGAGPYDVRIDRYSLRHSELRRTGGSHSLVPQGDASLLPQDGGMAFGASRGICGARLLPAKR